MKRLLSICFALILVSNLIGYNLLIDFIQQRQQVALDQRINTGVDHSEMVSLKVPAALPYYTNSKDFQWVNGEVEIQGVIYQYVKRRIYNDSIEYLCLKNPDKSKLISARDRFFQLAYDLQSQKQKGSNNTVQVKLLQLEYCNWDQPIVIAGLLKESNNWQVLPEDLLPCRFSSYIGKPPDRLIQG